MSLQPRTDAGSTRAAIRWGLLLAMVGTVGFRLPRVLHEWIAWREAQRIADASEVGAWSARLLVDVAGIAVVLAIGFAAFYVLRPEPGAKREGAVSE